MLRLEAAAEIEHLTKERNDMNTAYDDLTREYGEVCGRRDDLRKEVERLAESARQTEDEFCQQKILKALTAERDDLRKEVEASRADAGRYRWIRTHTMGERDDLRVPQFYLPSVETLPGVNIMRGSVAEHLDAAVDAAMNGGG